MVGLEPELPVFGLLGLTVGFQELRAGPAAG